MYLTYIDGIRAFAILSIFIYHLNPQILPGGFAGVDVFFVISGYLVSLSLDKYKDISLPDILARFYSGRIKRIFPALLFCLLITILLTILFIPDSYLSSTHVKTAFYSFFGVSNIFLASGHSDYFGPTAEFNPFTHTWALGVEEQFYFVFPFIFFFWRLGRHVYKKLSAFAFSLLFLISLGISCYYSQVNQMYGYYLITSRFWELAAGILLYQFMKSRYEFFLKPYYKQFVVLSWLAFFCILISFVISDANSFPFPWGLLSVGGTFLLLLSFHYTQSGFIYKIHNNLIAVTIGKMSYSIYLWHWPVIILFKWTVGIDGPIQIASVITITFLLSFFSYNFIERFFLNSATIQRFPRYAVIACGLATVLFSSCVGHCLFNKREVFTFSITKNRQLWYSEWYAVNEKAPDRKPHVAHNAFNGGDKISLNNLRASDNGANVFVLGDSHAVAYIALMKKFVSETGQSAVIYWMPGCGDTFNITPENMQSGCKEFLGSSLSDIGSQAKPGDVLFLVSLKLNRFTDQWENLDVNGQKHRMSSKEAREARKKTVAVNLEMFRPLADKGVRVVFEAPKPIFKSPIFRCTEWFNKSNPVCKAGLEVDRNELLSYRQPVMDTIEKVSKALPNSSIFDPFTTLCPGKVCMAIVEGKPLFFDGDHLSAHGNLILLDDFINLVNGKK